MLQRYKRFPSNIVLHALHSVCQQRMNFWCGEPRESGQQSPVAFSDVTERESGNDLNREETHREGGDERLLLSWVILRYRPSQLCALTSTLSPALVTTSDIGTTRSSSALNVHVCV